MWFPFLVAFSLGYALIAALQWIWAHRVGVIIFLAFCMILGLVADAVDAIINGTVAQRTAAMSLTVVGIFEDFSRYDVNGEHLVRVRITNPTKRTLRSFQAVCGDFYIYDDSAVPPRSTAIRTYPFIDTSKRVGRCSFDDALVSDGNS
jgi:hypothetical protein